MAYNYDDQIPTWTNEGTEPAESVKLEGYKAGYKPPASYFNWFWNRTLRWLNDLRSKVSSLHTQVETIEDKVETLENKDYDVSADDVLTKLKSVDGAESGLDADLLDGKHASAFADVDHTHTQYATATHTHALATKTSNGFMSSEMFSKLEAFDPENLSTYTHPSTHPASMITGLHQVATSGNYADLVNKPVLSGVATSGSYKDLLDLPTLYTHPSTHPASMITETENVKMMTAAERVKLANMNEKANFYEHPSTHPASMITETDALKIMTAAERTKLAGIATGANNYTHPSTHPASMITGLEAYMSTLGYGKSAVGSYVGDGTGDCYDAGKMMSVECLKGTLSGYSFRTIQLPFAPTLVMLFNKTKLSLNFAVAGGFGYVGDSGGTTVAVFYLTGNELRVLYKAKGNDSKVYGPNESGYTYYWLIF